MYRLLIVDDEENIRNGIQKNCDWSRFHISCTDTAATGAEAWEKIVQSPPDFVITDIKMPVMDGLELIEKISEGYPDILCAVLSGYDEFDFVREAMRHNVQDYLLKPCSIESIHELMETFVKRKSESSARKEYIKKIEAEYLHMKSIFAEQALKDYIVNSYTRPEELALYTDNSALDSDDLRLLLIHMENCPGGSALYSLQKTCQTVLSRISTIYVCTFCNDCLLVLVSYYPYDVLLPLIHEIRDTFGNYFSAHITVTVGEKTSLHLLKSSYKNLLVCSGSRFYPGNDDIITTFDIPDAKFSVSSENFNIDLFCLAVQRGNTEELNVMLRKLHQSLSSSKYDIHQIRSYLIHVYVSVIQLADASMISDYLDGIMQITSLSSLSEIIELIRCTTESIITSMQFQMQKRQTELIKKLFSYIDEYLCDERLTLSFIAHELLYVNVDYLGKVFSAECGEKFSSYITHKRIDLAKSLLLDEKHIPVNEIAHQTGFGYNSQYFSKVFKKSTGYTPTEYRSKFSEYI